MFRYKLQNSLAVINGDGTNRLAFAKYCHTQQSVSCGSLKQIVFSDESEFSLTGRVNKQNRLILGTEQPNQVHEVLQHTPSIMFGAQ